MTRRTLIGALGALPILAQTSPVPPPAAESVVKNYGGASDPQRTAPMLCVLSSNMSKVPWEQLGDIARQMGFDGVDLTCYPGGHVEPAIIAVDLVRAFEVVRGAGINVPIVTTKVTNLAEPNAFGIIALSGNSGVPVYRTGLWKYGQNVSPMLRMQEIKRDLAQMVMGGVQYKIAAAIPNRLGPYFGSSIAETSRLIADLPPQGVGYFFDVAQAVALAPKEDWLLSLKTALPRLKAVSISDFTFNKDGEFMPCPMGAGIVDWKQVFGVLAQARYMGPVSIEMAYKSGSEVAAMQKDLEFARKQISTAYALGGKS